MIWFLFGFAKKVWVLVCVFLYFPYICTLLYNKNTIVVPMILEARRTKMTELIKQYYYSL